MKRLFRLMWIMILGIPVVTSCDDFLELSSQDLIIPETVEHYKEILQGEGYFKDILAQGWFVMLMTDDIEYHAGIPSANGEISESTYVSNGEFVYKWDGEIESEIWKETLFRYLYKQALVANVCLDGLKQAEGTEVEKKILKGQACFTRGFAYLMLANLYAQAYNEAREDDLCVPLTFDPTPSLQRYERATIKEVWTQIVADIDTAMYCLKDVDITNLYEINYNAALVLATRTALYMENYDKVIEYGNEFLAIHPELYDITGITRSPSTSSSGNCFLFPEVNEEIVFLFGKNTVIWSTVLNNMDYYDCFRASESSPSALIAEFGDNDNEKRKVYWFEPPKESFLGNEAPWLASSRYCPLKYNRYDIKGGGYVNALRSGEVYLSLAEAYARKASPDKGKAVGLLNDLRRNRIADYTDLTTGDFASNEELVKFIWKERRLELCFEEFHRWWDLRRIGQPEITHEWKNNLIYKLEEKDPAYVMNFPKYEREFNPELVENPRPVRNEQK